MLCGVVLAYSPARGVCDVVCFGVAWRGVHYSPVKGEVRCFLFGVFSIWWCSLLACGRKSYEILVRGSAHGWVCAYGCMGDHA